MLLSIVIYTSTALILSWLGYHISTRESLILNDDKKVLPFYSWEIVVTILFFAFVSGARYKTGFDYTLYMNQYKMLLVYGNFNRTDMYECGYVFISKIFAALNAHVFFFFAFWALLQITTFYYAFRKRKYLYVWIPLIIMLTGYYVNWMNTIRQVVVECVFVAIIPLIFERKKWPVVLIISLILTTIHRSALLMVVFSIFVLLLENVKLSRKRLFIIFITCVIVGIYPIWLKLFVWVPIIFDWIGYDKYGPKFMNIVEGSFRITPWGPTHILALLVDILIIYYFPKVKSMFRGDTMVKNYFDLAFMGMCMENLLLNTSHFILRPFEYLTMFEIVMLAFTFHYLFKTKRYLELCVLATCSFLPIYVAVYKATYMPTPVNLPYLYNTIFLQ